MKGINNTQNKLLKIESNAELLWQIKNLPKIDLHRHLTGTIDAELAIQIASKYNIGLPTCYQSELNEIITRRPKPLSHEDYFARWNILNRLFISKKSTYEIVKQILRKASEDNIVYMELRMAPRGFLGFNEFSFENFIKVVSNAVTDAEKEYGIITRCILGISRHETFSKIHKKDTLYKMFTWIISCIKEYSPNIFVGVDLNGIESVNDDSLFVNFFSLASKEGFKITAHAGELGSDKNVEKVIELLSTDRIGHGLAAAKQPSIMETLKSQDIALEICPTSNWFLGIVKHIRELPLHIFSEYDVPFVICTDNPSICQTNMSEELFKICLYFDLSISDIKSLIKKSLKYSFSDEETKEKIEKKLKDNID